MLMNNTIYSRICRFFNDEHIEYYAALPFCECEIINPKRIGNFKPQSAVAFLIPYYTASYDERNVSLYSVSRDYHLYAKELETRLLQHLDSTQHTFRLFCDSSPINERALALKAGLGVMGKNHLIINEKYKSYVFIGTILTCAVFQEDEYTVPVEEKGCISCGKCQKSCEFLRGESEICLSQLNQQKNVTGEQLKTILSQKIRWGCDTCQQVCPMNIDVCKTPIPFFYEDTIPVVSKDIINSMSEEAFRQRAYSWRGKNTILRNLSQVEYD